MSQPPDRFLLVLWPGREYPTIVDIPDFAGKDDALWHRVAQRLADINGRSVDLHLLPEGTVELFIPEVAR